MVCLFVYGSFVAGRLFSDFNSCSFFVKKIKISLKKISYLSLIITWATATNKSNKFADA